MNLFQSKSRNARTRILAISILLAFNSFCYALDFITEGSGAAEVTYDGETHSYPLQIGFGLDTDFSNPKNAIAVFSKTKWEDVTNPRRILIRTDTEKVGKFSIDQKNRYFVFVQDGGQLYYPTEPCSIEISKPYTGDSNSQLRGEIDSCNVHSAGIDHTISVKFEVLGTPKWKTKSNYDF